MPDMSRSIVFGAAIGGALGLLLGAVPAFFAQYLLQFPFPMNSWILPWLAIWGLIILWSAAIGAFVGCVGRRRP